MPESPLFDVLQFPAPRAHTVRKPVLIGGQVYYQVVDIKPEGQAGSGEWVNVPGVAGHVMRITLTAAGASAVSSVR